MNYEKGKRYLVVNRDEDERVNQNPFEIEVVDVTGRAIKILWEDNYDARPTWFLKDNFNKRWKLFEIIN